MFTFKTCDLPKNRAFENIKDVPRYWRKNNAKSLDLSLFSIVAFVNFSFSVSLQYFFSPRQNFNAYRVPSIESLKLLTIFGAEMDQNGRRSNYML